MTFATVEGFEARHGALGDTDEGVVGARLDDASTLIVSEVADSTKEWVTGDEDPPAAVKLVCIQVAYRAWRNPDGIARQQLGEHAVTYRGDDQPDAIYLTRNERRLIRRAARTGTEPRLTSIGLVSPYSGPADDGPPDFTWGDLHGGTWANG
jgi:hypothetical protein